MIGSSLAWYKVVEKSRDRLMTNFERQPTVKRDLAHFQENAARIKNVDDLMKDRKSLKVVLSSFQLESEIDKRALLKKVLTQPLDDKKSLANRMLDPRYKQLAQALQPLFAKGDPFGDPKAVESIVGGFKTNEFEKAQGEQAPGMREVMYFKRSIGKVTDLTQIMADKTLMKVVRVGLGFPPQFGALDYEQQKSRLEPRVDVEKFKDPKFVEKFVQRFLIMNEQETGGGAPVDPIVSLIQPVAPGGAFQPMGINLLV